MGDHQLYSDKGRTADANDFDDSFNANSEVSEYHTDNDNFTVEDIKNMSIAPGEDAYTESQGKMIFVAGGASMLEALHDSLAASETGLGQNMENYNVPLDKEIIPPSAQFLKPILNTSEFDTLRSIPQSLLPGDIRPLVTILDATDQAGDKVDQAIEDIKAMKADNPDAEVILLGHSKGGEEIVQIAEALGEENINVDLMVQFDSVGVGDETKLDNVAQSLNVYVPGPSWFSGAERIDGALANIPIPNTTHFSIDDSPDIHAMINEMVQASLSGHLNVAKAEEIAKLYGFEVDHQEPTIPVTETYKITDAGIPAGVPDMEVDTLDPEGVESETMEPIQEDTYEVTSQGFEVDHQEPIMPVTDVYEITDAGIPAGVPEIEVDTLDPEVVESETMEPIQEDTHEFTPEEIEYQQSLYPSEQNVEDDFAQSQSIAPESDFAEINEPIFDPEETNYSDQVNSLSDSRKMFSQDLFSDPFSHDFHPTVETIPESDQTILSPPPIDQPTVAFKNEIDTFPSTEPAAIDPMHLVAHNFDNPMSSHTSDDTVNNADNFEDNMSHNHFDDGLSSSDLEVGGFSGSFDDGFSSVDTDNFSGSFNDGFSSSFDSGVSDSGSDAGSDGGGGGDGGGGE